MDKQTQKILLTLIDIVKNTAKFEDLPTLEMLGAQTSGVKTRSASPKKDDGVKVDNTKLKAVLYHYKQEWAPDVENFEQVYFGRFSKAAKQLLLLTGNVDQIKKAITITKQEMSKLGYTWTLDTVVKRWNLIEEKAKSSWL